MFRSHFPTVICSILRFAKKELIFIKIKNILFQKHTFKFVIKSADAQHYFILILAPTRTWTLRYVLTFQYFCLFHFVIKITHKNLILNFSAAHSTRPWDLIYPKGKEGLPAYNPVGKYAVKLFWMVFYLFFEKNSLFLF
jgi:hypothetical protein